MSTLTVDLVDLALDADALGGYLADPRITAADPKPNPDDPEDPDEPDEGDVIVFVLPA